MKIQVKVNVNEKGNVEVTVETIEDFWVLTAIIRPGDKVVAPIRRKVKFVTSTGKQNTEVKLLKACTVKVTEIEYQPGVNEMWLRGTLTHDVEDAKAGSYQRVLIEIGRPFTIRKKCWDKFSLTELQDAANPETHATVAAVMMQCGLANICVVGRNATVVKSTIKKAIPKVRVRGAGQKSDDAKQKFYQMTAQAFVKDVNVDEMKCIIVASQGAYATEFMDYLNAHSAELKLQKSLRENKFIVSSVSDAHLQSLEGLLADPVLGQRVQNLRAVDQARAWNDLMRQMGQNDRLTALGQAETQRCLEMGAVRQLLVTDEYILSLERPERLEFCALQDRMESAGTPVVVFSARHESGQRLKELGGIAAILKFEVEKDDDQGEFDHEGDFPE